MPVIQFLRSRPPHYAGEKIGADPVTAARLIAAGYAVPYDIEAEARLGVPVPEAAPVIIVAPLVPAPTQQAGVARPGRPPTA